MYFLWYLLLGLASGWIANLIVKGNGSGLIINSSSDLSAAYWAAGSSRSSGWRR